MLHKLIKVIIVAVISLMIPATITAQKDNRKAALSAASLYLISAKAGAVNYVSGTVSVEQTDGKSGLLQKGDMVEVGDKISTGADGRAEILLNPGSYIRLAGNSQFEFLTTSLDDLQLKVNRGSAMFEVIADKDFSITVKTSDARFYLITAGVFRVDVGETGGGRISVWKGKAQVGDIKATVVKGGRSATMENGLVALAKFDRDKKGDFENWSRDRAKEIAKINDKLLQRQMNRSLFNSFGNNSWNPNGYGLWVQDPWSRTFCFLPFGYGWSSPYGFGYSQSIWSYSLPTQMIAPIYQNQNANNNNGQTVMNPPPPLSVGGNLGGNLGNSGGMPASGGIPASQGPTSIQTKESFPQTSRPNIVERKKDIDN